MVNWVVVVAARMFGLLDCWIANDTSEQATLYA